VRFLVLGNRGDRECLSGWGAVVERDLVDLTGASWAQAVERLRGVAWVLSMRYHGLILGAAAGAAVAGWGHDPKLANLLGELQAPDLRTLGWPALKSLLARGVAARQEQEPGAAQLRQRAADMAKRLQEFLTDL
jgi:polysaccharide pyruvyl transferase WcaK-like protein